MHETEFKLGIYQASTSDCREFHNESNTNFILISGNKVMGNDNKV
jgi:hypothetical protein